VFSWVHLALVILGGVIGTAARLGITLASGEGLGPALVPVVNVTGAFLLGLVLGGGTRSRPARTPAGAQHFLGAGILGGFTTYSALAVESVDPAGMAWGAATVIAGTLAAWAGVVVARRRKAPR